MALISSCRVAAQTRLTLTTSGTAYHKFMIASIGTRPAVDEAVIGSHKVERIVGNMADRVGVGCGYAVFGCSLFGFGLLGFNFLGCFSLYYGLGFLFSSLATRTNGPA